LTYRVCFECGICTRVATHPVFQKLPCDNKDHKHYTYNTPGNPYPDRLEEVRPVGKDGEPVEETYSERQEATA